MLRIFEARPRMGRRELMRIGGGAWLASVLGRMAQADSVDVRPLIRPRSVILIFLHGGPSQFETFDPKMAAPADIRSATGEISTALAGVTFGSSFPRLAALAKHLTIVRSFTTGDANHDIKPVVGRDTHGANIGSLYARVAGAANRQTGLPTNVMLFPQAVDPTTGPAQGAFGRFESTGAFGPSFAPFVPGGGSAFEQDLQLTLAVDRLADRRAILAELDRAQWLLDVARGHGAIDQLREQAFQSVTSGEVLRAFDLSREDPRIVERYDTAPLVRPDQIDKKWNNYEFYVDNAKSLGKLLLLARRLCEAGCGFVTVTTNFVWDMHADINNAPMPEGMRYTGPPLDHALSALIEDLVQRGLDKRVLVVCCGEMGRTPRVNSNGGRDHWGNLAPLLLAGAGMPAGHVIGQSTRDGGRPATEPVQIKNLVATMLSSLIDVAQLRTLRGIPDEIVRSAADVPIEAFA